MPEKKCVYITIGIIVGVLAVIIISLVASSLERLESDEIGLEYDTFVMDLGKQAESEGLHTGTPGFKFIKFPSTFETISLDFGCLNKDGVTVEIRIGFQYRVRPKKLYEIVKEFKDYDNYRTVLEFIAKSAIFEVCSLYNTSQFGSERGTFQADVGETLVNKFDDLHCDVADIQVNNIQRPGRYDDAVQDKERAREQIHIEESQRARSLIQAQTNKRQAESTARVTVARADSDARIILNQAEKQAYAIVNEYVKEAEVYEQILSGGGLDLTTEGFLSYIGVRTISAATNPVYIGLKGPAKTSYVEN